MANERHVRFSLTRIKSLQAVLKYWKRTRSVIQAGGSYGVWPKMLAKKYDNVYTFEPDAVSFRCLCRNCPEKNIHAFRAALGYRKECLTIRPKSFTAHRVIGVGATVGIRVDDIGWPRCDAILLDVEGFEPYVLQAAKSTIHTFRPLVLVEIRPEMFKFYGLKDGACESFMENMGYIEVANIQCDKIFVHHLEMKHWKRPLDGKGK